MIGCQAARLLARLRAKLPAKLWALQAKLRATAEVGAANATRMQAVSADLRAQKDLCDTTYSALRDLHRATTLRKTALAGQVAIANATLTDVREEHGPLRQVAGPPVERKDQRQRCFPVGMLWQHQAVLCRLAAGRPVPHRPIGGAR